MLNIEKNIPTPKDKRGPPKKYPFDEMVVGDSFFVPFDDSDKASFRNKVSTSASRAAERLGYIFTTRVVDGGIRCWMVSNNRHTNDDEI